MIEKIIEISNLGHFVNFKFKGTKEWNGQLKRLNIIYAPNGSGKTTLSTILKSISQNNLDLIKFKKTFGSPNEPKVIMKQYGNEKLINLGQTSWTQNNLKIEVFDINYIEEYLFSGSFVRKQNKVNLFKLLLGQKGIDYRLQIKPLLHKKDRLEKAILRENEIESNQQQLDICNENINVIIKEYDDYSNSIYDLHKQKVNKYLSKFTSYIKLSEFSYSKNTTDFEKFRIFPVFEVYDEKVIFSAPDQLNKIGNARYSMSEGDKSTIALCFFLARLEINGVNDKIIVFDDPLSSFDYSRRNSTLFQLSKIANTSVQFILLTHDLGFANDFTDKCSFIDLINLKIENNEKGSYLAYHDINAEFLTATQKDLEVIKNYLLKSVTSENDKREVIRCIRPALEGVFKTKYFDLIANNIWLGEIIELIKKSTNNRLNKLNEILEDVIELNDYTKQFHHSSGNSNNERIDSSELKRYISLLMSTIDKI